MDTIILFNIGEILVEAIFRKKIEALGTYKSLDEKVEAMLAQEQRDLAENPEDFPFDEWPED